MTWSMLTPVSVAVFLLDCILKTHFGAQIVYFYQYDN